MSTFAILLGRHCRRHRHQLVHAGLPGIVLLVAAIILETIALIRSAP